MKMRVIVDEGVNAGSPLVKRFQQTLPPGQDVEWTFVARQHRAMPDNLILSRLLGPGGILLTRDRVLHNQACDLGFRSYILDEQGNLRQRKLPGVCARPALPPPAEDSVQEDYAHPANRIASALKLALEEHDFKRYRTKRRRIRSYFGSEAQISSASITIGARNSREGHICGFFLALAGYSGVRGIRASEGYALARGAWEPAFCLLHGLRELYLLQLEQIPTELFVIPGDALNLADQLLVRNEGAVASAPSNAVSILLAGIKQVRLQPCVKGRFFDAMEEKLDQLATGRSNELVPTDFLEIVAALSSR